MLKKSIIEALGTFWLVFCGCGAALLSAKFLNVGVGILGVAFAFGFAVVTFAYAFGHISGAHMNPAITTANYFAGRINIAELFSYILFQVIGAVLASCLLYYIVNGSTTFNFPQSGFATNGYGLNSPGGYGLSIAFVTEFVMTFMFTFLTLGVTRTQNNYAPLAIGFALTLIHVVTIPITNTSVNPARSTGPALIYQQIALSQLWLFWAAPLLGAIVSGLLYKLFIKNT